jgi:hypothetical protein
MIMRKLAILSMLLFLPLFVSAQTFDFNKSRSGWNYGGGTVKVKEGVLTFSIDGSSKSPNIRKSNINADEAQYIHIVLKNNTNAAENMYFIFKDDHENKVYTRVGISNDDKEFKTYSVFMGAKKEWTGKRHLNIRFANNKDMVKGKVEIDKIVFSENKSID